MKKLFSKIERPAESSSSFNYQHLKSTEIRLLRLQPSSGHGFTKSLSGSLMIIQLQDVDRSTLTQFEALSYFWGRGAADRTLYLDNTPFSIKPNLDNALRELSKGKVERLLWVDALCINQKDIHEQNEQVRMMGSIYRQARRVIIWIGPRFRNGKSDAKEAIEGFVQRQKQGVDSQSLSTYLENPYKRVETERHVGLFSDYTTAKSVDHDGGHWPALVDFFDRPWWRRVWVRCVCHMFLYLYQSSILSFIEGPSRHEI